MAVTNTIQSTKDGTTVCEKPNSENMLTEDPFSCLIESLANNSEVECKSQQKNETEVPRDEKIKILTDIFEKSKSTFLYRFGSFLNTDQAKLFQQFKNDPDDGYDICFYLKNLADQHSNRNKLLRNRRYAALKQLEKDSYFSEKEMRKRNPLLYEQLVGRYLSVGERKLQEKQDQCKTFVGILLDGIETEAIETKRRRQEEAEDAAREETSSDDESDDEPNASSSVKRKYEKPSTALWGEFVDENELPKRMRIPLTDNEMSITAQERKLLKEEFITSMYESFLEGKDEDFDYATVDNNDEYDNLEILNNDEQEKYFDSEEPEDMNMIDDGGKNGKEDESSEDELDIYMNALNQHPAVCKLSEDMKKL